MNKPMTPPVSLHAPDDCITFDDFLRFWAKERADTNVLECAGRETTFAEADHISRKIITVLSERGIGKGDRIAWLGKNSDRYFLLLYACGRMGAVMAPLGWRLAPPEIGYIVSDTNSKLIIAEEDLWETANGVAKGVEHAPEVVEIEAFLAEANKAEPTDAAPLDPDEPVLQLYTSGTTGNPKGVQLSNRNLFALRKPGSDAGLEYLDYREGDCILCVMPVAHIAGTGAGVIGMSSGARSLVQAEFTPDGVIDAVEKGATHMFLVPAAVQMAIQHPKAAETDWSGLRYLMYGAAPMPLELLKQAVRTMPQTGFMQVYGMTETTGTVTYLPPEDHDVEGNQRMTSAGKACPGVTAEVRDENNKAVPYGQIGEICIHSPSNTQGYWKLPDATASTIDEDGWLHTGDAGIMDEDGYIYIQDRIKDMIISGGENVYPAQVESAIYGHPAVAEVAVIGVPSEKWGEEVKACIVAKPGMGVDEASVIAYARERIAAFKAPKSVDVIPEMPRNASGKILRRTLRAPFWEGQERQVS